MKITDADVKNVYLGNQRSCLTPSSINFSNAWLFAQVVCSSTYLHLGQSGVAQRGAEMNISLRHREKSAIRQIRVYPLLHHTVDILFFLNSYSEFTEPVTHLQIFFVRFAKHALSQTLVTSDSIQRYSYHFLFIPHELRKVGHLELLQLIQGIRHPFPHSAFI